jgi:hypothetical protein
MSRIAQGTPGNTIRNIAAVLPTGTVKLQTALAAQPAEIHFRIARRMPARTRANGATVSREGLAIVLIGRSRLAIVSGSIRVEDSAAE